MNAYREMIAPDSFPLYTLFIDLDPAQLDINVHPTKQEIKFGDEKLVYAFVQAAVKHALAQFSITPTLDFDLDPDIQRLDAVNKPVTEARRAAVANSSLYQTFTQKNQAHVIEPSDKSDLKHWRENSSKAALHQRWLPRYPSRPTPIPGSHKRFIVQHRRSFPVHNGQQVFLHYPAQRRRRTAAIAQHLYRNPDEPWLPADPSAIRPRTDPL